jgi:DNA-binding response OmpR family regulator
MTILIVDDDAAIRHMLTTFLTYKGYRAIGVANGEEALTHLQYTPILPELILLDVMMPAMDGPEFRCAQQQDPQFATIPVVVMSAADNLQAKALILTADAYVPKPIDFDALLALVEQYHYQSRQHGR